MRSAAFVLGWTLCPPCFDIALFGDAACSTCNAQIPLGQSRDVFIVAQNFTTTGIAGAELRVIGLPAGWMHVATPGPQANFALGDPFGDVGANIGFAGSQFGECILLYRVTIVATSAVDDITLTVTQRNPPTNPNFPCPLIQVDCPSCNWNVCVPGRGMSINAGQDCAVATLPGTWSTVKSLYAN